MHLAEDLQHREGMITAAASSPLPVIVIERLINRQGEHGAHVNLNLLEQLFTVFLASNVHYVQHRMYTTIVRRSNARLAF